MGLNPGDNGRAGLPPLPIAAVGVPYFVFRTACYVDSSLLYSH
jgi:hypothetical protein